VYFCIPYVIGQATLAVAALHNETCLFLSLGLLAMGTGVIKPNISTLMGQTYDQQRPGRDKLRSDAFAMYYGAINIGAFLSSLCVPAIRNYFGGSSRAYAIAFLFPTVLMILSFIVFVAGKPFYAVEKIQRTTISPEERRQRWVVLRRLLGLFLVVTVFWSIFFQAETTWTLFARDYLHLHLFGMSLSPDQLLAVNPLWLILLLPLVTLFWHFLSNRGINLRPTSKMLIGFVITFIAMLVVTWAGFRAERAVVRGGPAVIDSAQRSAAAACQAQPLNVQAVADSLIGAELADQAVKLTVTDEMKDRPEQLAAMLAAGLKFRESVASRSGEQAALKNVQQVNDALRAIQSSLEKLQKTANDEMAAAKKLLEDPQLAATAALASAAQASKCAVQCAQAALRLAESSNKDRDTALKADVLSLAQYADAAAEAVKMAARAADKGDDPPSKVLAQCAKIENLVTASATSARKAVEVLDFEKDNPSLKNVSRQYASIASLVSADAAALALDTSTTLAVEYNLSGYESGKNVSPSKQTRKNPLVVETEHAAAAGRISIWWIVVLYVLLTIAEICISVVGLELAFTAAPATMKSFVTACWLLTIFLANLLNAQVTPLYSQYLPSLRVTLLPGLYFGLFAAALIPVTLAFVLTARRFNQTKAGD
jgi:dipeptide/tripeptide permease